MDLNMINIVTLAYMGDAVYEVYIRKSLIDKGHLKADELQKMEVKYVSAKGQVKILDKLLEQGVLSEEEEDIVRRGRNYKRSYHPKNTDIMTYKKSTGFEALIGYLYMDSNYDRLEEIFGYIEVE